VPTALHLLKLPSMPNHHGLDIAPLIQGKPGALAHDVVFSEYLENEEAMVRSPRFKLIVGSGQRLRQDGYHTAEPLPRQPYERLYDEIADPEETNDLSEDPRFTAVKAELLERMYERFVATRADIKRFARPASIRGEIDRYLVPPDKPLPPPAAPRDDQGRQSRVKPAGP
jgi:arylsulfatase A-like enzyme